MSLTGDALLLKLRAAKAKTPPSRRYQQAEQRIEAHIFIAFLAYCLHVTLGQQPKALAPGLTPRAVFKKFAAVHMMDVYAPIPMDVS